MIYTGYFGGQPLINDHFPELLTMPEPMMEAWAKEHLSEIDGCWTNYLYLLDGVPEDQIVFVYEDGREQRLVDMPGWESERGVFTAGEFIGGILSQQK